MSERERVLTHLNLSPLGMSLPRIQTLTRHLSFKTTTDDDDEFWRDVVESFGLVDERYFPDPREYFRFVAENLKASRTIGVCLDTKQRVIATDGCPEKQASVLNGTDSEIKRTVHESARYNTSAQIETPSPSGYWSDKAMPPMQVNIHPASFVSTIEFRCKVVPLKQLSSTETGLAPFASGKISRMQLEYEPTKRLIAELREDQSMPPDLVRKKYLARRREVRRMRKSKKEVSKVLARL